MNTTISLAMALMLASPVQAEMDELQGIKEQLSQQYSYDNETLESLAKKIQRGEELDCMKEEYSWVEPYSETFEDGEYHAVYLYPDGSAIVLSVTGGTITQGSYISGGNWYTWTNALVSGSAPGIAMQFHSTFSGSQYDATISSVHSPSASISGSPVAGSLSIVNGHVTSGYATARLSYGSSSLTLKVPVGSANPTAVLSY